MAIPPSPVHPGRPFIWAGRGCRRGGDPSGAAEIDKVAKAVLGEADLAEFDLAIFDLGVFDLGMVDLGEICTGQWVAIRPSPSGSRRAKPVCCRAAQGGQLPGSGTERQLNQPLRVATSTFLATLDSPIANFSGTTTRLGSLSIAVNSRSLVP